MSQKDGAIEVLHITDCHLNADRNRDLLGVNTYDSLRAVLDQIEADGREPDCILVTGDISQDGSIEAYQTLKQSLSSFSCPVRWFAGNHDVRPSMASVIGDGPELNKVLEIGEWQLILLDSLSPGNVFGELTEEELDVLEQSLQQSTKHALVCLHHHPVPVKSQWIDKIGLHSPQKFLRIVQENETVRGVLWGHIHQEYDAQHFGRRFLASPSTCIQFKPKSDAFALDDVAPGYRWLALRPDGTIETSVHRANAFEFELDLQSNGY